MRKAHEEKDILISEISVRDDRVTPLNDDAVKLIEQSVYEEGAFRDAIHVRKLRKGYELIDGRHRLEVARKMGWPRISAKVWHGTQDQARFMEASANVTFTHMAPLDLARSLAARKAAYLKLHPETKAGVAGAEARWNAQATKMSFASFMAEILGVSVRQIERIIAAGEHLTDEEAKQLAGAPKRVAMKDLAEIGKIGAPEERAFVVRALAAGEAKNASAARKAWSRAQHGEEAEATDKVEAAHKALVAAFRRAPTEAQRRFVATESARIFRYLKELDGGLAE